MAQVCLWRKKRDTAMCVGEIVAMAASRACGCLKPLQLTLIGAVNWAGRRAGYSLQKPVIISASHPG